MQKKNAFKGFGIKIGTLLNGATGWTEKCT